MRFARCILGLSTNCDSVCTYSVLSTQSVGILASRAGIELLLPWHLPCSFYSQPRETLANTFQLHLLQEVSPALALQSCTAFSPSKFFAPLFLHPKMFFACYSYAKVPCTEGKVTLAQNRLRCFPSFLDAANIPGIHTFVHCTTKTPCLMLPISSLSEAVIPRRFGSRRGDAMLVWRS